MKNAAKPAFPIYTDDMQVEGSAGLSKRERLAMAAMQGILSKQAGVGDQLGDLTTRNMDEVAAASVQFADALLAELEKTEES